MSYLPNNVQIRDTAQIYNLFIDALLAAYDISLFTPSSNTKNAGEPGTKEPSYKRHLSKLELKAALVLASVSRNRNDEIILKKSSLRAKLDCGKNELNRVLQNLKKAHLIECQDITYEGNKRFINVKLTSSFKGKLLKKNGYIKITAEQVEELLKIADVRSLRLAIHQIAALHRIRTQKHTTKSGATYTERVHESTLEYGDIKQIAGKYVKTKKYIERTISGMKNLFSVKSTPFSVTFSFTPEKDTITYLENKKERYFEIFEKVFGDALNNIQLCDIKDFSGARDKFLAMKQQILDKKEDIATGFVELTLQNDIDFAKDVLNSVFKKFTTTTDILKHPLKYINVTAKNRREEIFELEVQQEKERRSQRVAWTNQKRLAKLKKEYAS